MFVKRRFYRLFLENLFNRARKCKLGVPFMKKVCILLLALLLLCPMSVSASADEFELEITNTGVYPTRINVGDTVSMEFTISNISTDEEEKLWDGVMFIDQEIISESTASYITIIEPEGVPVTFVGGNHSSTQLYPGETTTVTLSFTIHGDAPGGSYLIPVTLTGRRGHCNLGCDPYRTDNPTYVSLNVIHGIPALSLSVSDDNHAVLGDTLLIDFTVKNLGSADASQISAVFSSTYASMVSQTNIQNNQTTLEPGKTLGGTIAIITSSLDVGEFAGELTVTFKDAKSQTYTQKKNVSFSIFTSDEATLEDFGNEAYELAIEAYNVPSYEEAIEYFSQAKGYYHLLNMSTEVEDCDNYIGLCFNAIEEELTPPPCPEPESRNYLLLAGLGTGFVVTLAGILAGLSKR